ncbi:MAG: FtsK/SpoIIIE domain-containing protein, partial [Eubacteriales bacterium]|nr:FtsK/SpoIIIE domain-containing protein [Eubacteriales bacterium]
MGVQITLFTKNYVRKYLLPPLSNGDYSLLLEKEALGLSRPYVLHLEVLRGIWRIHPGTDYEVVLESRFLKKPEELRTDGFFGIRLKEGVELSAGVRKVERVIRSFRKLRLTAEKEILIGRREECDVLCREQKQISGVHGVMRWAGGIWYIRCYSDNGIYINGKLSGGEHPLTFGDRIQIAELTMVFLGRVLAVDASAGTVEFRLPEWKERNQKQERISILPEKENSGRGLPGSEADPSLYHRAPRKIPAVKFAPVEIEEPPREAVQETRPLWLMIGPPLTMALPMILGFGLMRMAFGGRSGGYLYAGLLMSVTAALGSVFWAVMNQRRASKKSREKETHRKKAYLAYLLRKKTELKEIAEDFRKHRQNLYPPPEEYVGLRNRQGLWERTPIHSDFMQYRLGIGEVPFPTEIKIPKERFLLDMDELTEHPGRIKKELSVLTEVPILCDLSGESMVGMVSDRSPDSSAELGTLIGAQIGALNCYTEVKIAVVFNETRGEQAKYWEFAKWLPHIWSEDHKVRYYAANREEGAEVLAQLSRVLRERTALQKENSRLRFLPHILLFISEEEMKEHRDFQHLFQQENRKLGFTVCVMAQSVQRLPHICHRIIEKTSSCSGIYCTDGSEKTDGKVEFDRVTPADLERFARSISGIRVSEQTEKGEIPSKITFLKLHQVTSPEELHAEERWLKNRTYDNIRGELGIMSGGNRLCLDLHEKYHGPHGLLAGTTGSGKSETLLTFLLSLAVNYSPEELNYFLIDYKGGGMASMMEGLPHLAGSISNLSGNHIYRALVSIKSENQKRQRMFLEYEVNHIDAYLRLYQNGEAKEAIPHLLIVVDEFAELKKAEPEFMRELISVAQVGRSLGVHLILATQKPAGVVDDHIRSNAHFRICLRVQDRQDSTDLLHKPDAANLTQIGRGYLQVGNDEIYEEFQSGYSGASYDPENKRDAGES